MQRISLRSVNKTFELEENRPRSFQELALGWARGERRRVHKTLHALQDISFCIGDGETVGLIGTNGSGKSTCLKLMTRILWPSSGSVTVDGRVAALLELGAGFHPELTGRENIILNGSVLGIGRREMMARFDDIVAFAELDRFIDVPVKVYSSGMYVRLAFATAISVDADILLVDEVLAVGDQAFQEKCLNRIKELKESGVTIVIVSHDLANLRKFCDRVIWLDGGRQVMDGPGDKVIDRYLAHFVEGDAALADVVDPACAQPPASDLSEACECDADLATGTGDQTDSQQDCEQALVGEPDVEPTPEPESVAELEPEPTSGCEPEQSAPELESAPAPAPEAIPETPAGPVPERWGTGRMSITGVDILDGQGAKTCSLETDQPAEIVIHYEAQERVGDAAFGVAFHLADGAHISGNNTILSGVPVEPIEGRGTIRYQIERLTLLPGDYLLSVAVHNLQETEAYDYHSLYYDLRVELGEASPDQGLVHIPARWEVNEAVPRS